jgi:N-acetylglucosamine-6-phosphate deacetylase
MMPPRRLLVGEALLATPAGPTAGDLLIDRGKIVAVGRDLEAAGADRLDARGLTAGPGFVDVHVHGGGGFSFFTIDPENVRQYALWAPRNGVTGFLVSTVGRDAEETERAFAALAPAIGVGPRAEPLGFHMEGPFISPARKGAFHPNMLRLPSVAEFERFQAAAHGRIRQVTFAPELPGALHLARAIEASGAIPAVGHTDATAEEARAGFDAGARHVTHLFNAMRPLHQREGGPIAASLLEERATCELVCDGAHVAPESCGWHTASSVARTVVVTDNLHIAGTAEAGGTFGGQAVEVSGAKAVGQTAPSSAAWRPWTSTSATPSSSGCRRRDRVPALLHESGAGRWGAVTQGALEPAMDGDVVLLDGDLQVVATVCGGNVAFNREPARLRLATAG